jgi:hypothetical protein
MYDYRVGCEQLADGAHIQEVQLPEGEARWPADFSQVPFLVRAGIKRIEVVNSDHFVTPGNQRPHQMRSDEPRGAGDQYSTHLRPRPIP